MHPDGFVSAVHFLVWLRALQQVRGHLAELSKGSVTVTKAEMLGWACKVVQIAHNWTTCSCLNNSRSEEKPEISKNFSWALKDCSK